MSLIPVFIPNFTLTTFVRALSAALLRRLSLLSCCICILSAVAHSQPLKDFSLPSVLHEASGLYIASPDTLWWHNDSGGEPALFATSPSGEWLDSVHVPGAVNRDWEDITVGPDGTWYLGDFGNNCNCRKDLTIYLWHRSTAKLDSIRFTYPDQLAFPPPKPLWNYNMEGFFWDNDSLHLFSKNRIGQGSDVTRHYVLAAKAGEQSAMLVDSLQLDDRVVTAAAISPSGESVALLSYTYRLVAGIFPRSRATVYIFRDFPPGRYLQGTITSYRLRSWPRPTQFEAVDFYDETTILVGSEATAGRSAHARWVQLKKSKK